MQANYFSPPTLSIFSFDPKIPIVCKITTTTTKNTHTQHKLIKKKNYRNNEENSPKNLCFNLMIHDKNKSLMNE